MKTWIVIFGTGLDTGDASCICVSYCYTDYHAKQLLRALKLNGTPAILHNP